MSPTQPLHQQNDPNASLDADVEALEETLADLRKGKSPKTFSVDPEFQAAVRLHTYTSDAEIDPAFEQQLRARLLDHFAYPRSTEQPKNITLWKRWAIAAFSTAAVVGIALAVALKMPSKDTTEQDDNTNQAGNLASVPQSEDRQLSTPDQSASTIPSSEETEGDEVEATTNSIPSETGQDVNEPSAVELAVATEFKEVTALQEDLEETIAELESLLDDLEAMESMENSADDASSTVEELLTL